jgi:transposase-like protein
MKQARTLLAYLQDQGVELDAGFLREALRIMMQLLMEVEVSAAIEATPYERKQGRAAYRNGYRRRVVRTSLGEISLDIPKLRKGTYYPSFIESLPRAEGVLLALIQDAYVQGVSISNVETGLRSLGVSVAHKSQIADISQELDDLVYQFRQRPLESVYPDLVLDTLDLNVQQPEHVIRLKAALAIGLRADGQREVVGFELTSHHQDTDFWKIFLRGLVERGLTNVEAVRGANEDVLRRAVYEVWGEGVWDKGRTERLEPMRWLDAAPLVSALAAVLVDTPSLPAGWPKMLLAASVHCAPDSDREAISVLARLQQAMLHRYDAVGSVAETTEDYFGYEHLLAA